MQNTVRNTVRIAALSAIFGVGSGAASALHAAEDAVNRAASPAPDRIERRQMTEDFSAKAQYNRSKKEAQAAYAEALKNCKTMSKSERAACKQEAKQNLQSDLSYAKEQLSSGQSYGSSATQGKSSAQQPPAGHASGGLIEDSGRGARARDAYGAPQRPGY